MECIRVWGFEYKSYGGWGKRMPTWTPECDDPKWAFGTGRWQRSTLEIYLMAARGAPLICSHGERNFVEAPLREHSRKPDEAREALERMFRASRRSNCSRASDAGAGMSGATRSTCSRSRDQRARAARADRRDGGGEPPVEGGVEPSLLWPSDIYNAAERVVLSMLLARSPNSSSRKAYCARRSTSIKRGENIRSVVWRLRKKLAPLDIDIKNARGEGYYLDAASAIRARKLLGQNEREP